MDIIFKYRAHSVSLINVNVSTYTSYKEHYQEHTENPDLTDVNRCLVQLFKNDKIVLEDIIFIKHSKSQQ